MSAMTGEAASCRSIPQGDGCPTAARAVPAPASKAPIVTAPIVTAAIVTAAIVTAYALKRENTGICITAPVPQVLVISISLVVVMTALARRRNRRDRDSLTPPAADEVCATDRVLGRH